MTVAVTETTPPEIVQTRRWIERVVVGLGLCPFARNPLVEGRIAYRLCVESDRDKQLAALLEELDRLQATEEDELATSLVIYPHGLGDFDEFLQCISEAEELLEAAGLTGIIQLAHFHPQYQFAGEPADDPSHYSNRAPYPVLHLLREASLTRLLAAYPNPETIPERNIQYLRELGRPALDRLLAGLQSEQEGPV